MSEHLLNVSPQTLVILCDVLLPLIPGLTIDHLDYLDLQQPDEEHCQRESKHGNCGDVKGEPGLEAHHGCQVWEDEGENVEQGDLTLDIPDKAPIVDVAVDPCHNHVDAQGKEVAMVGIAHTCSSEPAVVVVLQHTHLAQRTVVWPWWEVGHTGTAVIPARRGGTGGEHHFLSCYVCQEHHQPVAVDVDSEEDAEEEVDLVGRGPFRVVESSNVAQLVPEEKYSTEEEDSHRDLVA